MNVLLQEKTDWDTAKKVLNRGTFLQDLKTFDKDRSGQGSDRVMAGGVLSNASEPGENVDVPSKCVGGPIGP